MKKIVDFLLNLGLTKMEVKVYLKLLSSGPLTVSEIAKEISLNRTATYAYINSLLQKGVIIKSKGTVSKIEANPPEHLSGLVDQQIGKTKILEDTLPSIITALNANYKTKSPYLKSETKYYFGKHGVKAIYKDALQSSELRSYFNLHAQQATFPENEKLFTDAVKKNRKMKILEIVEDTEESRLVMLSNAKNSGYFYKFFPPGLKLLATDILIYNGHVAIINVEDKNNISGIVLKNSDYYNNSVQMFDLLWRLLPTPK